VAAQGLSDRVRFEEGNFLEDELPRAAVIVMGHVLPDWDIARKKLLVAKASAASEGRCGIVMMPSSTTIAGKMGLVF
jgi:hypothetical protein